MSARLHQEPFLCENRVCSDLRVDLRFAKILRIQSTCAGYQKEVSMPVLKSFPVFGEQVEVLIDGKTSDGLVAVVTQVSPPGGGPPPHLHTREDETFTVVEGEFEIFNGTSWVPLRQGESFFGPRGITHTFRNSGKTVGKIHVVVHPAGMDEYLERISVLRMPEDHEELTRISDAYGISFPPPPPRAS